MIIKLNMNSEIPIYLQLRNQIILAVGSGVITVGQRLPTVRALASEIGINTMTVNKTYALLKKEGFIEIDRRHGAKISAVMNNDIKADIAISDLTEGKKAVDKINTAEEKIEKENIIASNTIHKDDELVHQTGDSKSKTRRVLSQLLSNSKADSNEASLETAEKFDSNKSLPANLDRNSRENLLLLLTEATLKGARKDELYALCKQLIGGINIVMEV